MNHPIESFVVLTGTMRSGTSLLGYLLQRTPDGQRAHPRLAFENDESRWIADLFARAMQSAGAGGTGFGDPYEQVALCGLVRDALAGFLGVSEADLADALRARLRAEILKLAPPGPSPSMLGLKRTSMNNEIGIVEELFPETRAIFMVRNPMAVVASHCRRLQVDPSSGDGLLVVAYILSNLVMIEGMRTSSSPLLVVRYEDLVRKPADILESVQDFLGLGQGCWSSEVLADARIPNNSSFGATRGTGFGKGGGIRSWQPAKDAALGEVVAAFVAWLCHPVFVAFGYEEHHQVMAPRREEFRSLLSSMRQACARRRISFTAVEARLRDLGFLLDGG